MWESPRVLWCLALIPYLMGVCGTAGGIWRGHVPGNLTVFLGAARQMVAGGDIYDSGTRGYLYPPLIAFLYQPLTFLRGDVAGYVSLGINTLVSIFTLQLVSRTLLYRLTGKVDRLLVARVALFAAICSGDKIKTELYHLETNVFMLLAFSAAMRWVDKRPSWCGMALGFAFNIKYLPLVLMPYLILRRRWKALGWFAVFAVAFALLPATTMGWTANGHALMQAFGGIARLFGVHVAMAHAAAVPASANLTSISLTSGIARVTQLAQPWPLVIAAGIGGVFCLFAVGMYARSGVPIVAWPSVAAQEERPYRGLFSIEWMGMLLLMLIFGPFTNSPHLYMLMDVNAAAGVLLLATGREVVKWPLWVAAVVMAVGITFPPGSMAMFAREEHWWRMVGGASCCMLVMYTGLIYTNVRWQMGGEGRGVVEKGRAVGAAVMGRGALAEF